MYGFSTTLFFSKTSFVANISGNIAVSCLLRDQSLYPQVHLVFQSWNVMINFIFVWLLLNGVSMLNIVGKLKMRCIVSELEFFSSNQTIQYHENGPYLTAFLLKLHFQLTTHLQTVKPLRSWDPVIQFHVFTVCHHSNMFYLLNMYVPSSKATSATSLTIASESTKKQSALGEQCWDSQLMALNRVLAEEMMIG